MARARNIKPSIFMNEILGMADASLTVLFISLWCLADREGRLEDRPERIRISTFPYKVSFEIERSLNELQRSGFINRYEVEGERYIEVINFKKHQRPHPTEKNSLIPPCDSKALIIKAPENVNVKNPLDNVKKYEVKRADVLIPDVLIPDTGYLIQKHLQDHRQKTVDEDFEEAWRLYPKRPGANKTQAFKAWIARVKEGVSVSDMKVGVQRYRRYCEAMQTEPQFIKQAATFFGPDRHFLADWTTQGSKADKFDNWLNGSGADDDIIDI